MKRGSKKPCPGCGKIDEWRPADKVCSDCQHLLKNAAKWEKQLSKITKDEAVVSFGEMYHWNQYIYTHINNVDNLSSQIMRQFHELCKAAPTREAVNRPHEFTLMGKIEQYNAPKYVMPRRLAEAIKNLYDMLQPMIDKVYEAGKNDGHNLLRRLATGDIAPNEFLQKTEAE